MQIANTLGVSSTFPSALCTTVEAMASDKRKARPIMDLSASFLGRDRLTSWLKLNRIILDDDTSDDILQDSLSAIMRSFGSIRDFFLFIAKSVRYDRGTSEFIHRAISKQSIIHKNKDNEAAEQDNERQKQVKPLNAMQSISNESVTHISNYLAKTDIQSFKLTSRRNAIISLEQMGKYSVSIVNANTLFEREPCLNFIDFKLLMIRNRYPSTKT